jgi:hypothetical protein
LTAPHSFLVVRSTLTPPWLMALLPLLWRLTTLNRLDIYWLVYKQILSGLSSAVSDQNSQIGRELTIRCPDHYIETRGQLGRHGVNHPSFPTEQCSGQSSRTVYTERMLTRRRSMFPGLGTAIVAFTAYVIYDDFIAAKPKHDSHGHGGH